MKQTRNSICTIASLAILILAYNSAHAAELSALFVESRAMNFSGRGAAAVQGCLEGGSPPCAGTTRVRYTGQVTGSPFDQFNFLREPSDFVGYLDFQSSAYDPEAGCYLNVSGVFQIFVYRGNRGRVAVELIAEGRSCGSGSNSFFSTVLVDATNTEDPLFRNSTGSGTIRLNDDLDLSIPDSGTFVADVGGAITTRQ